MNGWANEAFIIVYSHISSAIQREKKAPETSANSNGRRWAKRKSHTHTHSQTYIEKAHTVWMPFNLIGTNAACHFRSGNVNILLCCANEMQTTTTPTTKMSSKRSGRFSLILFRFLLFSLFSSHFNTIWDALNTPESFWYAYTFPQRLCYVLCHTHCRGLRVEKTTISHWFRLFNPWSRRCYFHLFPQRT